MHSKHTIAGVVLTLNEEQDLSRALRSLAWCDELLVIDSGSTDQTQAVAENCGARFLQHIQPPPFLITDQRNWALEQAGLKSDWVLFLDADEEIGTELAESICLCINIPDGFHAYELTPRYWFFGRWLKRTQGYPNWHPRLVKRGCVKFQGGVWESFSPGAFVGRLSHPYEHYAFSKGFDDWLDRHRRYSNWEAASIVEHLMNKRISFHSSSRHPYLRLLMSNLWFFRPPLRFIQKYVLQLGFTEGWQAFVFASMMSFYDLMTVVKVIEKMRLKRGLPL